MALGAPAALRQINAFKLGFPAQRLLATIHGAAMTTLPHAFKRIRLNLARSKEFPEGSMRHGYEFVAPLTAMAASILSNGSSIASIAACGASGRKSPTRPAGWCTGPAPRAASWKFDYDPAASEDDEAGYRFGATVPARRICLDPRRGWRHAHLRGRGGGAGLVSRRALARLVPRQGLPTISTCTLRGPCAPRSRVFARYRRCAMGR